MLKRTKTNINKHFFLAVSSVFSAIIPEFHSFDTKVFDDWKKRQKIPELIIMEHINDFKYRN